MSIGLLGAFILLICAAWFWSDSLAARERVTAVCTRACAQVDVQFLDETVALRRLGLARSEAGHLVIRRLYRFDFSTAGHDRWRGHASLIGHKLISIELSYPDGNMTITDGKQGTRNRPMVRN